MHVVAARRPSDFTHDEGAWDVVGESLAVIGGVGEALEFAGDFVAVVDESVGLVGTVEVVGSG